MIYFVSNQKKLFEDPDIKECSVEYCLSYCSELSEIGFDTETTGFQPHGDRILLMQFGNKDIQFVVDNSVDYLLFKQILETKLILGQNLKFDLRFLYKLGIFPTKVYDTYLAEVKLTQGLPDVKRNLEALNDKYVGDKSVDKSLRGLIHKGITPTVIKYAANDVKNLEIIKSIQLEEARRLEVTRAIDLENRFVLSLAYIEFSGLYVDQDKWSKKVKSRERDLQLVKDKLNKYILENNIVKFIDTQLDLFSSEKKVIINWNSDKQVKDLFKYLGINVITIEKGIKKESVDAKVLTPQKDNFPILPIYLEYKKLEKDLSTYGYKFLKQINKHTGRLHTNFTQIVDTGRMASGGKNKSTGEEYINFQNIPADAETRNCFTNQFESTILINCDYSGMEQVFLANKSKDKDLIAFYEKSTSDMHSYIASKIYPELREVSLKEIKDKYKDKRQIAKSAGFAINYGGTGFTIAKNLSISKEEGEEVERAYFTAFPGLKNYFDLQESLTLKNGYILIDDITGSKLFIPKFDEFKSLEEKFDFNNKEFWNKYKIEKVNASSWYKDIKEELSYYFRWKSQIRRNSLNYPIQGGSSSITKIAGILLFDWIKSNNMINKVLISNIVHDEFIIECPKNIADTVSRAVKDCMEKAGSYYCKLVPLKASPVITNHWEH